MNRRKEFAIVLGTRPEIIKLCPLIREFDKRHIDFSLIHTGQHYTYHLDQSFFDQLKLPSPDYNLEAGSGTHAESTAKMLVALEKIFSTIAPKVVIVEGDTNTVLAAALAASKLGIKIAHVEAGLRSFDNSMPEEINRVLTDRLSSLLFAPTTTSKENLVKEGVNRRKIFITGNTIVDALRIYRDLIRKHEMGALLDRLSKPYILLTLHRQENVDNASRFRNILRGLELLSQSTSLPVIYPIHPRAKKNWTKFRIKIPSQLTIIDPIDYFSFVTLERKASLVMTDSGGVQEEACILGTPCVTLRDNTERPETISVGANVLSGTSPDRILSKGLKMIAVPRKWPNPFGDGHSAKRIERILTKSVN